MADTKGKAARFMLIKLLTEGMVTSSEIEAVANVKSDAINKNFNKIKQWLAPMEITVQSFNDHDRIFRLNTAPKTIDFRRTLIIAKIIIASRAFSKADLSAVIKGLMAPFKVVNKDELFKVLLKPSRDEYQPVQSLVDVNTFETICHALSDQHVLKIIYQDAHGQIAQRELDPLSIDFNDHYFYLRAILYNVPEKANNIRNYRIDRIQQASLTSLPIDCDPDAIETSRSANINSLAASTERLKKSCSAVRAASSSHHSTNFPMRPRSIMKMTLLRRSMTPENKSRLTLISWLPMRKTSSLKPTWPIFKVL